MQEIKFTNINPPVLRKIIHDGENTSICYVSKIFFCQFDRVMQEKWNFFLEEEEKQGQSILKNIEAQCEKIKYTLSNKEACSPGLRRFKIFFESSSQEMIKKAFICSSYKELSELKKINDSSVCALVENIKTRHNNQHRNDPITLIYKTASQARSELRFIGKTKRFRKILTHDFFKAIVIGDHDTKYLQVIPSEFFHAFKHLKSLALCHIPELTSLPPEISLMKDLKELELRETGITCIPQEVCQLNLKKLVIGKHPLISIPDGLLAHKTLNKVIASEPANLFSFSKFSSIPTFLIANDSKDCMQVMCNVEKGSKLFVKGVGWKARHIDVYTSYADSAFPLIPEEVNFPLSPTDTADQWVLPDPREFDTLVFKIVKTDEQGQNQVEEQGANRSYSLPYRPKQHDEMPNYWKIFIAPRF